MRGERQHVESGLTSGGRASFSFLLPRYPHSGYGPHSLLPSRQADVPLPSPLRSLPLLNAPCSRRTSPGNIAPCKPLPSACSARRMSVMAIAERLVARVSFSQKLTGPKRGPSKCESERKGCSGGMEGGAGGETQFPITHPPSPARRAQVEKKEARLLEAHRERRVPTPPAPANLPYSLTRLRKGDSLRKQAPARGMLLPSFGREGSFDTRAGSRAARPLLLFHTIQTFNQNEDL